MVVRWDEMKPANRKRLLSNTTRAPSLLLDRTASPHAHPHGKTSRRPAGRLGPLPGRHRRGPPPPGLRGLLPGHDRPRRSRAGRRVPRFPLARAGQVRRGHPLLPAARRDGSHDGGQDFQGAALPAVQLAPAPARPADDPHVRAPLLDAKEGLPRRLADDGDCQRVCRRGDSLRPGHRLRPRVARAGGPAHPPRPHRLAAEGHRVRLADRQGDGPARHRPERGGEGPGRAGGRGGRGDRRVHPPRRRRSAAPAASRWSRWPSRGRTCASTCPRSAC